jgi:microcystin-dependent protein
MSQPYLGQIEAFPFGFAPRGWQACSGQLLPINQNTALFSLLGTTYGGNGTQTFALPDLRGRVAMGQGNGGGLTQRVIGETLGEENHTILVPEMPAHTHLLMTTANANTTNNTNIPSSSVVLGSATGMAGTTPITISPYAATPPNPSVPLNPAAVGLNNGGLPHNNMMPYTCLQFCIAMQGIFPQRS